MRERTYKNYDNFMLFISFVMILCLLVRAFSIIYDYYGLSENRSAHSNTLKYVGKNLQPDDLNWLENLANENNVILNVEGCRLRLGDLNMNNLITVFLHSDEESVQEVNSVVLGKSLTQIVNDKGYLLLENMQFKVSHYLRNNLTDDNSIHLFWGNLSAEYKDLLCSCINARNASTENCYFYVESMTPLDGCIREIKERFGEDCLQNGNYQTDNYLKTFENKMMIAAAAVLIVFAMICCIMMADLWMIRRKREYLICIALGFGRWQMLARMFKEFGKPVTWAFAVTVLMEFGRELLNGAFVGNLERYLFGVMALMVGCILVMGITLLIPLKKIEKIPPTQGNVDLA